ncbi:uncharacterized protein [Henckelia pumila]|uniref:uncharacterized protein n=1 Tax=Henckelia pumila TaxID=405737 RepID=UPI003C6E1AD1
MLSKEIQESAIINPPICFTHPFEIESSLPPFVSFPLVLWHAFPVRAIVPCLCLSSRAPLSLVPLPPQKETTGDPATKPTLLNLQGNPPVGNPPPNPPVGNPPPPNPPADANGLFDDLKISFEEMASKLDGHHRFLLDLANYYFAFQGILLAAVSGSSYFSCSTGWFITLLAGLCAVPSLSTMGFLAHGWLQMMREIDQVLREIDAIHGDIDEVRARMVEHMKNRFSVTIGREYSGMTRYILVIGCGAITAVFTAAVAFLPYKFICAVRPNSMFPSP